MILWKKLACFREELWIVYLTRLNTRQRKAWLFQLQNTQTSETLASTWHKRPFRVIGCADLPGKTYCRSPQRFQRTKYCPSSVLVSLTELGTRTEFRLRISEPARFCAMISPLFMAYQSMSCQLIMILWKKLVYFRKYKTRMQYYIKVKGEMLSVLSFYILQYWFKVNWKNKRNRTATATQRLKVFCDI